MVGMSSHCYQQYNRDSQRRNIKINMPLQVRKSKSLKKIKSCLKVFKVKSLKRKTKMTMLDSEEAMVSLKYVEDSIAEEKQKHKKTLAKLLKEQKKEKLAGQQMREKELEEVNVACLNLKHEIDEDALCTDVLDRMQDEIVAMKAEIKQQKFRIRELELEKKRVALMNAIKTASLDNKTRKHEQ